MRRLFTLARATASLALIAAVTIAFNRGIEPKAPDALGVSPTTVALTYLVVILAIATGWGIAEATAASVLAVVCFNFFFLPPVGTFTIVDPQNWVAFVAFLITAVVTSQLSGRARRRTVEAVDRQRDLERLYTLSRSLLLLEEGVPVGSAIARQVVDAFEFAFAGVYDQQTDQILWAGREMSGFDSTIRRAARRTGLERDDGVVALPITLGSTTVGALALPDSRVSDTVLHSVTSLAAIGIERARARESTARAQAAQQSGELRAIVLDAIAHEFKTPLTSLKGAVGALADNAAISPSDRELVAIAAEDVDYLQALISDAVQMLRVDAGQFVLHPERLRVDDVVAAALTRSGRRLEGHAVAKNVPEGLTVDADRELLGLAIRQLLDNAIKYSPSSSRIEVGATADDAVHLTVHNSGSVIPPGDRERIFERFFRGASARQVPGTGMGLAIVRQIAEAHGGTVSVFSDRNAGTVLTLTLPKERAA